MDYILNRLSERSTWQGMAALAAGVGVALKPELVEAITAVGIAAIGLIHVLWPDAGTAQNPTVTVHQDDVAK
jgi:hypothetical protein